MAYETEYANISHVTDVISDAVSPALVNKVVAAPHVYMEDLPTGTMIKLFRKDGYLTAEEVNESAVQAVDGAEQELSMTEITATAVKLAATCHLTVETQTFTPISLGEIARKIGEAIARDWDDEILALFSGFSTGVTATSVLTWDDVLEAAYTVRSGTAGVSDGPLVGIFDYKGIFELQKEFTASGAAHLSNQSEISLLKGVNGANGFTGEKGGVWTYNTSGLPTSSSDDVALVFDPRIAFAGMASPSVNIRTRWLGAAGDGTRGFVDEVTGWIFCDIVEWNDGAGVMVKSDT